MIRPLRRHGVRPPTKGHERREVPLPRFLVGELAVHLGHKSATMTLDLASDKAFNLVGPTGFEPALPP